MPIFYKTSPAPRRILAHRMKAELSINGEAHAVEADADTPLLWVLRDHLGMTGTKFGCGIGQCGACTVHLDGTASALLPDAARVRGGHEDHDHRRPVTRIRVIRCNAPGWKFNVAQCGYCQAGLLMAAAALLREHPQPHG